jgi:hypothetical protein
MFEHQDKSCAICSVELSEIFAYNGERPKPVIDHNHETGQFRGILCNHCNLFIGHAKEDTERLYKAIVYLTERSSKTSKRGHHEETYEDAEENG